MYNEATLACRIISDEPPPEAQGRTEDRLGGPPSGPELAPAAVRAQRVAMAKAHLNLEERIELEAALRAGDTQATVAARLVRSAGTISREVALNGGPDNYRKEHRVSPEPLWLAEAAGVIFAEAPKSAPWKIALAAWMKRRSSASNRWLGEQLTTKVRG